MPMPKKSAIAELPGLASVLSQIVSHATAKEAKRFIVQSCSRTQRKELSKLAGLEAAWIAADQAIAANVEDMADAIVDELYKPFWFFRRSLIDHQPRALFGRRMVTRPLKRHSKHGFWTASSAHALCEWLPAADCTFDAVVHFVQSGSGTGVHAGGGRILTCAHVVDARDDDATIDGGRLPSRRGRLKAVMFGCGRTFLAECVAVEETLDGTRDSALLRLVEPLDLAALPEVADERGTAASRSSPEGEALPSAAVATEPVERGGRLFCVGNPSNVDLEKIGHGRIEFDPPTWHGSEGTCMGYEDATSAALRESMASRGRPPTRGELKQVAEACAVDAAAGTTLMHTCWTYWGHSGAPLIDASGKVCGLHCSWDPHSGMRHAQKLEHLQTVLAKAEDAVAVRRDGKKRGAPSANVGYDGKRRATSAVAALASAGASGSGAVVAHGEYAKEKEEEDNDEEDDDVAPLGQRLAKRMREASGSAL